MPRPPTALLAVACALLAVVVESKKAKVAAPAAPLGPSTASLAATATVVFAYFLLAAAAAKRASGQIFPLCLIKTSSLSVAAAWLVIGAALLFGVGLFGAAMPPRGALLTMAAAQIAHYGAELVMLVYLGATKDSHADNQRILHHTIGFCFVVAAFQVSDATYEEYKLFFWGFAAVVQGGSTFTKAVMLRRMLYPATKRDAVEYALIHLNPALNFVTYPCEMYLMTVGLKFPNLLYRAALSAQCVYDAYWLTRLVSSVKRYRASYKAGDDKGDSPGEKEHEAILKRQASH